TTLTKTSKGTDYMYALDIAKDCEMIVVASYFSIKDDANGKALSDDQLKFFKSILILNKKVIIISFENPYILSLFPNAENYICTFSNSNASQRAVVNLLNGSIEPNGRLPVSIPNTDFKIGYRWEPKSYN
ncbi:MAG: glycoside hydrolase family 3 C-terminal domain-containing protein, partial [Ignavibacteria bacterium]|nr:glycoside hydrolase family 3 C-terminal domain-containing protein [Ignavibacteria bacterium]